MRRLRSNVWNSVQIKCKGQHAFEDREAYLINFGLFGTKWVMKKDKQCLILDRPHRATFSAGATVQMYVVNAC